jgi:hypothetical protein
VKGLYVELAEADRALLDAIVADCSAAERRPVRVKEVIEQLVRDTAARGKPLRIRKASK